MKHKVIDVFEIMQKHVYKTRIVSNVCTQAAIRFFTAKYEILQLYPNGNSFFFYSEIRNFTVVPKRQFVFFTAKYEVLQLYPNGHSFFYSEIRNFPVVLKRQFVFFTAKYEIFQLYPNGHSFFYSEIQSAKIET